MPKSAKLGPAASKKLLQCRSILEAVDLFIAKATVEDDLSASVKRKFPCNFRTITIRKVIETFYLLDCEG